MLSVSNNSLLPLAHCILVVVAERCCRLVVKHITLFNHCQFFISVKVAQHHVPAKPIERNHFVEQSNIITFIIIPHYFPRKS